MNDLHQYDINEGSWTHLSPMIAGTAPSVRAYMGCEEWNGKLYVFGGENGKSVSQAPLTSQLLTWHTSVTAWLLFVHSSRCRLPRMAQKYSPFPRPFSPGHIRFFVTVCTTPSRPSVSAWLVCAVEREISWGVP